NAAAPATERAAPRLLLPAGPSRTGPGDGPSVLEGPSSVCTPGGRPRPALAIKSPAPAEQARRSVHDSPGQPRRIQVAATDVVAEHVGALVEAFAGRSAGIEIAVQAVPGEAFADLLEQRRADIAFGPRPAPERQATIATVPFLRCRLIVVAAPGHPLAASHDIPPAALAGECWLIGPPDIDRSEGVGLFFERNRLEPAETIAVTRHAAALAAAAAGESVVLT